MQDGLLDLGGVDVAGDGADYLRRLDAYLYGVLFALGLALDDSAECALA